MEPTQRLPFDPTTSGHNDDTLVNQRPASDPNPMPRFTLGWPSFLRSTTSRVLSGVAALIVLCIVCAFCGGVLNAMSGGASSSSSSSVNAALATATTALTATPTNLPRVSPTPTPTHAPTATPNPNDPAVVAAYASLVQTDSAPLVNDLNQVANDCGATLIDACQLDLQNVVTDSQSFENDLHQTPVPPCLASANTSLLHGLTLMQSAAQTINDGINNNDASLVIAGNTQLKQATNSIDTATVQITSAQCS